MSVSLDAAFIVIPAVGEPQQVRGDVMLSFERMVAFRYLRARREEGLISVIALFSLVGIALGVATLIVVLAVMNGVRGELIKSIIGLEGHVSIYSTAARHRRLRRTQPKKSPRCRA